MKDICMRLRIMVFMGAAYLLLGIRFAAAADANAELHALLSRQIELSVSVNEQQQRLEGCLSDPALTSPEIMELRRQLDRMRQQLTAAEIAAQPDQRSTDIRRELISTQNLLRVKIEALPAVRARIDRIEADRRTLQESGRRIRELRDATVK